MATHLKHYYPDIFYALFSSKKYSWLIYNFCNRPFTASGRSVTEIVLFVVTSPYNNICHFIAADMRPFIVVETPGFKNLIKVLEPKYIWILLQFKKVLAPLPALCFVKCLVQDSNWRKIHSHGRGKIKIDAHKRYPLPDHIWEFKAHLFLANLYFLTSCPFAWERGNVDFLKNELETFNEAKQNRDKKKKDCICSNALLFTITC